MDISQIPPELVGFYQNLNTLEQDQFQTAVVQRMNMLDVSKQLRTYRYRPLDYIHEKLRWSPWGGMNGSIGQVELIEDYRRTIIAQDERAAWENGSLEPKDMQHFVPGEPIQNWLSVDAGHNLGKTALLGGLLSHFFDCLQPSIIYCFAPEWIQINDLLFKEVRDQREGKGLPGQVLKRTPRINYRPAHFVSGRATQSTTKKGTERIHGQHQVHMMFVLDEAEGLDDYVFDAVQSMASGGLSIVLIARNPRTINCRAHTIRSANYVNAKTISCLDTPNVVEGRDVIPGMVRREYIEEMLEHAEIVDKHDPTNHTVEIPWKPGTIYKPQAVFLWRVLGIASEQETDDTFCAYGIYDAAVQRGRDIPFTPTATFAWFGVDAARFGGDLGTVYIRRGDWLWRSAAFPTSDSWTFYNHIMPQIKRSLETGVTHIEVRVDAGGGWGAGLVDLLNKTDQLNNPTEAPWTSLKEFQVYEVNFNGVPQNTRKYADLITQMYAEFGASVPQLNLWTPPQTLRDDLCRRPYGYVVRQQNLLQQLNSKKQFKAEFSRSPDDGDGAALAVVDTRVVYRKPMLLMAG